MLRLPVIGVGPLDRPLELGETRLSDGRRMCWAAFGDPEGTPLFWFHSTPGGRLQIPPATARKAAQLGRKIVCVARPGVGQSSDHAYGSFRESVSDIAEVASDIGADRFSIVALSGGDPMPLPAGTSSRSVSRPWPSARGGWRPSAAGGGAMPSGCLS